MVIQEPDHFNANMTLGSDCAAAGVIEAKWEATDAAGNVMNKAFFYFDQPTKWHLYDGVTLGAWTWRPTGAQGVGDAALDKTGKTQSSGSAEQASVAVPQNTPTTDVRVGSWATWQVGSDPNPCVLVLSAFGMRYDPSSNVNTGDGMVVYSGARGSFQQLLRGSTTWTSISGATLSSTGQMQIKIPWPKIITHYRFVIYSAPTIWGATSYLLTYNPQAGC
jgi:hypothetical protein